jgi:hypothetical protein
MQAHLVAGMYWCRRRYYEGIGSRSRTSQDTTMKPLTDRDEFLRILQKVLSTEVLLEGRLLVKFLEFVYYICSPRVTITDFCQAAKMAAKFSVPPKPSYLYPNNREELSQRLYGNMKQSES